jgi:signal transduction histidine kinase
MAAATNSSARTVSLVVIIAVLAVAAFMALNTREDRTVGEKLDSAIHKLDDGVDDAARELKDRTPAEKISDEVKDATDGDSR